jgi:phosphate-selective porin
MANGRQWQHAFPLFAAVMLALPALGQNTSSTSADDAAITRLEALFDAQQDRIEALQGRLASARGQDEDAARVEALKQQIREILSAEEFRESLMPPNLLAGYDGGFFIKSSDDNFLMKINGRMQFRWTHYDVQSTNRYLQPRLHKNDSTGFDFARVWVAFKGHAYSPNLTYLLQLRSDEGTGYDTRLREAYLNYRFDDAFQLQAGYFKIAALQQRATSNAELQFVSRSMTHAVFDLSRGLGVRVWGKLFEKRLEYFLDVLNSLNNPGRTISNDPPELDNNPALAFRLVWHALGDQPGKDLAEEADLAIHETPALDFAFHYAFNEDEGDQQTTSIPFPLPRRTPGVGGFGLTNTNGLQINQFGLASAFKYLGFSARGEYILRVVDPRRAGRPPFTPWWLLTRQGDTTAMHGAYMQMGYLLPIPGLERKLEAVARIGGISTLANGQEGAWEYAGGLNYYIDGNNFKLQADVTKITEVPISNSLSSLANVNDQPLIFRVQLQVNF